MRAFCIAGNKGGENMGKLNDRQEKFCIEYIKNGGNATTAYKAAGYMNTAAAHVNAGALMQKPEIKARTPPPLPLKWRIFLK